MILVGSSAGATLVASTVLSMRQMQSEATRQVVGLVMHCPCLSIFPLQYQSRLDPPIAESVPVSEE